ncbi:DNA cytosine methyltransferase [Aminobacter aminovorans]|uniref:DNA (cytosine-5-)-methyltransferase n=1 Tax=Aminobacter aminovorans TaxID=83263 RepID=A0AAC8YN62_AMIAI|nr:DNA cytosine methyltransferase [Aminobacter aminovorans]AMS41186.1 Modification methylase [Aminobacter aminovorans]MBB3705831.1 DNA (cytosine-5)-methyltransferase 1 [Aminobacter aminovorans]
MTGKKPKKMLVADLLCGAGGSSTGAERALKGLGLDMELVCLNHWPTAIDTHQRNHPEARHYVQDIATVRPHIIVPEGYLDLLMASPTCTHHSVARGGKPTSDQQRSDPWHIVTWLTELRVKRIIIENVWEFCGWGPVDPKTGKPIKERKGEYFHAWIETIKRLGFEPEWRKLNAADYGDATTRQRFILMARSDGRKVHWPMPTHRKRDDVNADLFSGALPWRPAKEIIDWSIKGKSIFGRKKDLAPKTMARIYAGAVKFGWPEPYLVILRRHMDGRSIHEPIPALATARHVGLAEPVIMNGRKGNKAKRVSIDPVPTLDTKGGVWLAEPLVLSQHNSGAPRSTKDPLPTIMTGGAGSEEHPGCARPMLVTVAHGNDAREKDPNSRRSHSLEDPLGVIHGDGSAYAVVEPFVLSRHADGTARSVEEPTPTQVAKHSHLLITSYYGATQTAGSGDDPLPTVTTKDRFGMVVPVTQSGGGAKARDVNVDQVPTMTTAKGGEFAFAEATPEYDILFRMLEPHELAAAMGFNTEEATYEFAGTKTDKIKQIGNAVSVSKMKACVGAIMADAAPKRREPAPVVFREAAE